MATGNLAASLDGVPTADREHLGRPRSPGGFGPPLHMSMREDDKMSNGNVEPIRRAYEAYAQGDVATMRVRRSDLEWTYLDPTLEEPEPQVCHGRHELEMAPVRQSERA